MTFFHILVDNGSFGTAMSFSFDIGVGVGLGSAVGVVDFEVLSADVVWVLCSLYEVYGDVVGAMR